MFNTNTTKRAFTLAEILITLAIIGVVAALTLPTLIQNHKKQEVSSKLQKIYSMMNQAILMSEIDNGPKESWSNCYKNTEETPVNIINGKSNYEKYILPYIKYSKAVDFNSVGGYNIAIYLNDSTVLVGKSTSVGIDYFFFPQGKNFNAETFGKYNDDMELIREDCGIKYFSFRFAPGSEDPGDTFHRKTGFEPYKWGLTTVTKESLTSGEFACTQDNKVKAWCTALIQLNNWKIPDYYPFKL